MNAKLKEIAEKYKKVSYNIDNYSVGGGLDNCKFASRRHEDAKSDEGKLTLGKANQLLSKATGMHVSEVQEVIHFAIPNLEWHHAGKLPRAYGGGMKKTYFVNADEIVQLAECWQSFVEKLALKKEEKRKANEAAKLRSEKQLDFLTAHAKKVTRLSSKPENFHETHREMNGRYGWFSSYGKSYNLPEFYTGWVFESAEKLNEFYTI